MSDGTNEGSVTPNAEGGTATPDGNGSTETPSGGDEGVRERARRLAAHPRVQRAVKLAKEHPLGAVATVAAAAALVELELAVGILAGLGATALLANRTGREARQDVVARGKRAVERARIALAKRPRSQPSGAAAASTGEAGAPPP
jgi:hypothetical protein